MRLAAVPSALSIRDDWMSKGLIFDIQAFSTHDGPGCRTNIFFMGCPLHCRWCSNPESWNKRKIMMYAETTCKWNDGCRLCVNHCPKGAISEGPDGNFAIDRELCNTCSTYECTAICPAHALKQCGKDYTVGDIVRILRRDMSSWGSIGGVTFTGGEPFVQHEFLYDVVMECKKYGIHTAIETSACTAPEIFMKIMPHIDFAFIDVKNMDDEQHKEATGVSIKQTLDNIRLLKQAGWRGRLVLRTPVIHDFNDSIENADKVIAFMKEVGLVEINLLKFHRMGVSKWKQLGKEYYYEEKGIGDMTDEEMNRLQAYYLDHNIACYIANDTPFG